MTTKMSWKGSIESHLVRTNLFGSKYDRHGNMKKLDTKFRKLPMVSETCRSQSNSYCIGGSGELNRSEGCPAEGFLWENQARHAWPLACPNLRKIHLVLMHILWALYNDTVDSSRRTRTICDPAYNQLQHRWLSSGATQATCQYKAHIMVCRRTRRK